MGEMAFRNMNTPTKKDTCTAQAAWTFGGLVGNNKGKGSSPPRNNNGKRKWSFPGGGGSSADAIDIEDDEDALFRDLLRAKAEKERSKAKHAGLEAQARKAKAEAVLMQAKFQMAMMKRLMPDMIAVDDAAGGGVQQEQQK